MEKREKIALINEKEKTIALFEKWEEHNCYYCEFSSNPAFIEYARYPFELIPKEELKEYVELDNKIVSECFEKYLDKIGSDINNYPTIEFYRIQQDIEVFKARIKEAK